MIEKGPFSHWQRVLRPRLPEPRPAMGRLPPVFQFSQQSLQDYVDCPRRFQLRYVEGQRWPAIQSEPVEEHEQFVRRGAEFHLLVRRHLLGVPAEALTPSDPLLKSWWDNYLTYPPDDLPVALRLPEVQLSTPLGDQRLLARFDLLALDPGERAVIVDWKTTHFRPSRQTLARRLQTHVYPFVLVEAGAHLFGGPIAPEQVTLIYWFAERPVEPEVFPYDAARHSENRKFLADLVAEVLAHTEEEWPLTDDERQCRYCVYRSLCSRGVEAGPLEDAGPDIVEGGVEFDFDLDEVDEIAF